MEEARSRYLKQFKVWTFGIIISFLTAGLFGYLFRDKDKDLMIPIVTGILFLPLIFTGLYGLRHGYCLSCRYGYVYTRSMSVTWNIILIILYFGIVWLTTIFIHD